MIAFSFPHNNFRYTMALIKQTAWLLLFSMALRFLYLFRNLEYFSQETWTDLGLAFLIGLRFDASLLATLLAPLFLLFSLPWANPILESSLCRRIHRLWISAVVILLALPNIADSELLHFTGRRLSFGLLKNTTDFSSMALPLLAHYWYLSLFALLACAGAIRLLLRIKPGTSSRPLGVLGTLGGSVLLILTLGLIIRGGLQGKPLRPQHAVVYNGSIKAASLSINSTQSLITSYSARTLEPLQLLKQDHVDLVAQLKKSQVFGEHVPEFDNVVVLIVESIGKEFLKSDSKPVSDIPFIESLGEKGLLFENNYSNGAISMMAINSVLASIPPLNVGALAYSSYPDTRVNGLPAILKRYGYSSAFFHGGPKGVFYFDTMALQAGFDRYIGQDEFRGQPQLKNYWGIDDDSYLQFMADELNQMREPFLGAVFTLSNHFPYAAPESFLTTRPQNEEPSKFRGAAFTDYAVRRFFEKAQQYPWFHRTLFVITGDHPAHEKNPEWEKALPVYQMVPLVFYHPGKKIGNGRSLRITQHADVVPSVLDFLGVGQREKKSITPFGHSVFQTRVPGRALVGFESGDTYLVAGQTVTHYSLATGASRIQKLPPPYVKVDSGAADLDPRSRDFIIKASLQYFDNGVIENNLYPLEENESQYARKGPDQTRSVVGP